MAQQQASEQHTARLVELPDHVTRFIDAASQALASSLDMEETLRTVTRLAVPDFCDVCTLKLLTQTDEMQVVSAAARTPEIEAGILSLEEEFSLANTAAYGVDAVNSMHIGSLRTGKPALSNDVPGALAYVVKHGVAMHPRLLDQWQKAVQRFGIRASISQPIITSGRALGMIDFLMTDSGRTFSPSDVALTSRLAVFAGLAIENAGLYRQALEQARARESLLAVASHELRNPIGTILLQTSLARREADGNNARLEAIERQIKQMMRLVDDLLDVAKVGAGTLSMTYEEFDLAELMRDVAASKQEQFARRKQVLTIELPGPMPCYSDRCRMEQVFENLLSNALKYGGDRPIIFGASFDGPLFMVYVQDGGPGIPRSARESIFERFKRHAPPTGIDGAGLGLWIVREIVRALNGTVHVEEVPNGGASFVLRLPRDARTPETREG